MHAAIEDVLAEQPRVLSALRSSREAAVEHTDSDVLALVEQRICELLGATLTKPPADPSLAASGLGQATLAFVEQWVIDVANITDDMVMVLRNELGDDRLMDFIHGVLTVEQRIRLDLAWDRLGLTP